MGPLYPCPNSKKPMKKVYQGYLMGPPTDPGPLAVPKFPNGQSTPGNYIHSVLDVPELHSPKCLLKKSPAFKAEVYPLSLLQNQHL
ncbi:unnamed protein product, partial [Staurois parvus]